jgi:wyosine [tRNA(Phe)-imidazoG37] synthetase (radical SAM superfamily)
MSILFHDVVFGPVKSRRLGVSLGINLLPVNSKFCTFNCIYCECGWDSQQLPKGEKLPGRELVRRRLEDKLIVLKESGMRPDAITFAGNGEPTIHPAFPAILDDTVRLRDQYFPYAAVSVLSNASMLDKPAVFEALKKADNNILKLDAGTEEMFRLINNPKSNITLAGLVEKLKAFQGKVIIQTLFLRGEYMGKSFDNSAGQELEHWISLIKEIRPQYVMIYPIDRETPLKTIENIPFEELRQIGERIEKEGIRTQVYS